MRTKKNANRHRAAERRAIVRFLRGMANYAYPWELFGESDLSTILRKAAFQWATAIEDGVHGR